MSDRVSERRRAAQLARHYRDQENLVLVLMVVVVAIMVTLVVLVASLVSALRVQQSLELASVEKDPAAFLALVHKDAVRTRSSWRIWGAIEPRRPRAAALARERPALSHFDRLFQRSGFATARYFEELHPRIGPDAPPTQRRTMNHEDVVDVCSRT